MLLIACLVSELPIRLAYTYTKDFDCVISSDFVTARPYLEVQVPVINELDYPFKILILYEIRR